MTPNGTAIRALRTAQKIGLRDFAHLTGLNRGYLSRLERGLTGASEDTIRRIADALGVDPADITRGEDVVPTAPDQQVEEKIPHPTSPEGQIFLYTPEQAELYLRSSPLQIRRAMYRRMIAFTPTPKGHHISGRQICEHIAKTEVRPLAETKSRQARSVA